MLVNSITNDSFVSLLPKNKRIKKLNKTNFVIYILYIIGATAYLFSLHDIEGIKMRCYSKERIECIYILAILIIFSSFFTSISIYLIIFKNYKKIHLIIIFIIYLIFYIIDHNDKVIKHGFYNFLAFSFSNVLFLTLFCLLKLFYYLIKKRKYIIIFLILFLNYYFVFKLNKYKLNHFSCNNWTKGLNNSYIDNLSKEYPCNILIPHPHSCYISEIGQYFDFTKIYRPTCFDPELLRYDKNRYLRDMDNLKYLELSKKNHFGYPLIFLY